MKPAHTFPISVKGIVIEDGKVWLRKNERGEWELPGGKIDIGEQPDEALMREIKEELGLEVSPIHIVSINMLTIEQSADEKNGVLVVIYLCQAKKRVGDVEKNGEAGESEFMQIDKNDVETMLMWEEYKKTILQVLQ